jgi:ABC-type bacteriocin/lantibiotic exporter with double-glycine peptidase domain
LAHPSNSLLNVPHHHQESDGYCLPACVQMVLDYLGLPCTQEQLACELDVRPPLGAPASNVLRLRSDVLDVTFTSGNLSDLRTQLAQGNPPIVFVQAGELPHWQDCVSQHAIVVVGLDEQTVQILDPAADPSPISVPIGDFLLAWSELDYIYAALVRPKPH